MLYRVDFSQAHFRWLYQPLYEKVYAFYIAQGDHKEDVDSRFIRLVGCDPSLYMLVKFKNEDYTSISSFCVINVVPFGPKNVQASVEAIESGGDSTFAQESLEYIEKTIKAHYLNLTRILMLCQYNKHRAFNKKYGFDAYRVVMVKDVKDLDSESV